MDRVFVDANVLFSAAYDSGRKIGELWKLPNIQIITSSYAAAEATRNIARKFPQRLGALSDLLSSTGLVLDAEIISEDRHKWQLPAKDIPILRAAIYARSSHLLTGDHDFAAYFGKSVEGVLVLRPSVYFQLKSAE